MKVETTDLLVIGGGVAGLAVALVAAIEGLSVIVCEKTAQVGGTAATSAGTVWIPGSTQSHRAGIADPLEAARRYLAAEVDTPDGAALRDVYLTSGARVLDYLEQHTQVHFSPAVRHPDYHDRNAGAAIGGRALVAKPFDGRLLGDKFAHVRPPMASMMVAGGMSVAKDDIGPLLRPWASMRAMRHVLSLIARHAVDRLNHPRGTRLVMGNALVARLLASLSDRDVEVRMQTAPVELHRDDKGRVSGATLTRDGQAWRVDARAGVVLACGGFGHGPAMREALIPHAGQTRSLMFAGNIGEGLALAQSVGGAVRADAHSTAAFWVPTSVWTQPDGSCELFPHFALDRAKPGLIAVNAAGRRFVNEGDSYHDFVMAMFRSHEQVPTLPAWLVCDSRFVRRYGLGRIRPGGWGRARAVREGYLQSASTIEGLAARIGVDAQGLADSVALNNRFAVSGVDEDFGKGESELNRFNGDAHHTPNPCIGAIVKAPFYAVAVWPADAGTSVGLQTDENGCVLNDAGNAVPGLYAAGADMASIMRGRYPGPGVTLGPALVFGWRTAMHAAGRPAD